MLISRRSILQRLLSAPAAASLSLLAVSSVTGCGDNPTPLPPLPGNRNDKQAQTDMEIPPGMPRLEKSSKKKKH